MVTVPATGAGKKKRWHSAIRQALALTVISGLCAVFILGTPMGAGALFGYLQAYPALDPAKLSQIAAGPPVAVVILSAGSRAYAPEFATGGKGTVDGLTLERIRYGAYIARQTKLPVLVSGGLEPPLATLMADSLSGDYGITPRWLESESRNTAENAIFSSRMLKSDGVRRVFLVTHAWHMKRAVAAFKANGMTVISAPTAFYSPMPDSLVSAITPSLGTLRMSGYGLHEFVGSIWYRFRYGY